MLGAVAHARTAAGTGAMGGPGRETESGDVQGGSYQLRSGSLRHVGLQEATLIMFTSACVRHACVGCLWYYITYGQSGVNSQQ